MSFSADQKEKIKHFLRIFWMVPIGKQEYLGLHIYK